MAEQNAQAAGAQAPTQGEKQSKKMPLMLISIAVVNMVVMLGIGFMMWQGRKKDAAEPKIEQVIKGEHETQGLEEHEEKTFSGRIVPLETFIVNLAGSKGRRIAKVNIEFELAGEKVFSEIEHRKAQIRDIIIILLSSKTYDQVSNREGKDQLREEVRDTVNSFLTQGKIKTVYFTEFIYN